MFLFGNKKSLTTVDIHSHLIPSVDDGVKSFNTSIELIKEFIELGYKKLVITPHINSVYPNTKSDILKKYHFLQNELVKKDINIELEIGAEYYIEEFFIDLLYRDELLSFGNKNYVLFEFSHIMSPTIDIDSLVYELFLKDYIPILAHPERYIYWHFNLDRFRELKEMGVLFQLNLNSLSGYYGMEIQKCARWLLKNSYIDFVGSDVHHKTHLKNLKRVLSSSIYKKLFEVNNILNNSLVNETSSVF